MLSRLFSVAIVCASSVVANAQIPTQNRVSPINYFGRFHGFGYSDGYHECKETKETKVRQVSFWKPWESMSSYYGDPTPPPAGRVIGPSYGSPTSLFSPHSSAPSVPVVRQQVTPLPGTIQSPALNYAPVTPQAHVPTPSYGLVQEPSRLDIAPIAPPALAPAPPASSYIPSPSDSRGPSNPPNTLAPSALGPSTPSNSFYETVPPAPPFRKDAPNGTKREESLDLPPKQESGDDYLVPPAPLRTEIRRPQGSISLTQPNGKR